MPINQPSHAHGQGYTDLNFMIRSLPTILRIPKALLRKRGDFGAVVRARELSDTIEDQVSATAGTLGFQRLFSAGSHALGDGIS